MYHSNCQKFKDECREQKTNNILSKSTWELVSLKHAMALEMFFTIVKGENNTLHNNHSSLSLN